MDKNIICIVMKMNLKLEKNNSGSQLENGGDQASAFV